MLTNRQGEMKKETTTHDRFGFICLKIVVVCKLRAFCRSFGIYCFLQFASAPKNSNATAANAAIA